MIIRRIEDQDIKELIEFNIRTYKERDKIGESFKYRYLNSPFKESFKDESLIAINEDNRIVGQALLLPSRLYYKGTEYPVYWGMDYFVEESFRGLSGVVLVKKTIEHENHFGAGLTKISLGVHLATGEKIVGYLRKYIKVRLASLLFPYIFINIKRKVKAPKFPESLNVKMGRFQRVHNSEDIVSDQGFWNCDFIEFNRSIEFIDWRFFYYKDKYFVYKYVPNDGANHEQPIYFVVRPVVWRKLKCLLLVDYRHPCEKRELFDEILKATKIIARKTRRAASITGCSLPSYKPILKRNWFIEFGTKLVLVSKFPLLSKLSDQDEDTMLVTFADSDCDFYYGNNRW